MMQDIQKTSPDARQEFAFSDRDFRMISELANARYGLFLQPSKKALVHSRLAKRLRALNLGSFEDYCDLLNRTEGDSEQTHLLSALTTNVTHFFREVHHFEYLKTVIAPTLTAKAKSGDAVRLWSAACSTGQEAYSIAATLLDIDPELRKYDVKILATDIDPQVVKTARDGLYPAEQIQAIPENWCRCLTRVATARADEFEMDNALKAMISFGELNLIADWPMQRCFDVIFCRNAAIYFDKTTQARLWQRFAAALGNDAHLMIGHSERLSGPAEADFKSVGITTYQKQTTNKHRDKGDEN
ncbi:chemotaxis protein methyltransferase CheR [Yoonia maricola]|uniref:Chemotaxis protein methyltransferase n=1 Tax=Yoonia maricola TaxID=420999 RepID=A0A2M8W1Z3_9RHOB|nr:protein-glutamate O-methyltransferase [Yoonia maricola]PJI84936.1 chemotaxis protein methyltransferase CheR [Yoonia maricola]